jgi:hypothetical protein
MNFLTFLPRHPAVVASLLPQRSEYQIIESNAEYFTRIDEIAQFDYTPSDQDILLSRVRTTGIVEERYEIEGVVFEIIDVGGQRNERKKWIHCFEDVNAIIYVAALSEYDQHLFEDKVRIIWGGRRTGSLMARPLRVY